MGWRAGLTVGPSLHSIRGCRIGFFGELCIRVTAVEPVGHDGKVLRKEPGLRDSQLESTCRLRGGAVLNRFEEDRVRFD